MSVVGFDIGNDNCVVAIVKPKAIQILQNDVSKYETPSVVSFTNNRRQIGSAGASSAGMYPLSTVSQIKRLIGQNYDDPGMSDEFKLLPFKITRGADGGILITVDYLKKTQVFTPVEILAMLLSHLKQMTERNGDGTPVVDCVIGIPSYFNDLQRVAYLNAIEIAGLNPLQLIHDGTATAIGYGYYNTDIKSPTIVVFVDVGNCDTQITVAEFEDKKVRILAHSYDRNVGGRDFDRTLYKYFAEEFKKKYMIDIDIDDKSSHLKARIRLMAACEKAKKVLTANREANISVDCLVDDKDLVGSIKREEFDKLSKYLIARIIKTCEVALMDLNGKLKISDVHSVELVGSGSRIPAIGSLIGDFFGKPPNRTLNGSECVARGCALRGVIFRTSNNRGYTYEVQDSLPFSVGFILRQKSNESIQNQLAQDRSNADSRDSTNSFKRGNLSTAESSTVQDSNIGFTMTKSSNQPPQNLLQQDSNISAEPIKDLQIDESDRNLTTAVSSTVIHAEAISDEFSKIKSYTVIFQKYHQFPCVFALNIQIFSQDFILSSFHQYQSAFPPNASQRSRHFRVDAFQNNGNFPFLVTVEIFINHHGVVVVQSAKTEKQIFRYGQWISLGKYWEDIKLYEISHIGMTLKSKYDAKERLKRLLQWDEQVEAVQHQKNALETFIYDTRSKLEDRYKNFAKVVEKERISQNLDDAEILVNDEGDHEIGKYLTKHQGLQNLVNQIERRCKCREESVQAIKGLENSITNQKNSASNNLVKGYCSFTEELLLVTKQLLRILPKDIEQFALLMEKIKRISNTIHESNNLLKDVSTIREKYVYFFCEATRHSLSAQHEDRLKLPNALEEGDKEEEARGQAVARLLYTIYDSRVEMIYLKCLDNIVKEEFDSLLEKVVGTCNCIEKSCEEQRPQDIPWDNMKIMQKELDGLRKVIQQHITSIEARIQASKNSGKLNSQGSSSNKETLTEEAEDEFIDLEDYLLEIEKQLWGRHRYFLGQDDERNISKIIKCLRQHKDVGKHPQQKAQLQKMLDPIKKRYQEYQNERIQAVGEFYECIIDIKLTTRSMPNDVANLVLKRCEEKGNWLTRTFPKPCSSWMVSDTKPWSSEIRTRMESFKTGCQGLMRDQGVDQQMHNPSMRGQLNSKSRVHRIVSSLFQ